MIPLLGTQIFSSLSKSSNSSDDFNNTSKSKSSSFSLKKINRRSKRKIPVSFVRSKTMDDKVTVVRITNEEEFKRYYPRNPTKVIPKYWELPNHKTFFNWIETNYTKYKATGIKKTMIIMEESDIFDIKN